MAGEDFEEFATLLETGIKPSFDACSLSNQSSETRNCAESIKIQDFSKLLTETRAKFFPDLDRVSIKITQLKASSYFLQAQPAKSSFLKKAAKRSYEVQLNDKLLECPPDNKSLEAILVHELMHIRDYQKMSSIKMADFATKYLLDRKFRTTYERETDRSAMKLGLGSGLSGYRTWIYQWLTPDQLKTKKRYYYSPEEISLWENEHNIRP
jgi:hypothetical protein